MNEPTRQVHLDFHTSEHIPEVGNNFSKKQFKEALKLGNLNQINIFGKCHHGWCYYPTKVKHAKMHPNLKIDLLGQQIEACSVKEATQDLIAGEQVLVREVILYCDESPQVFARSLLPLSSLTGDEQHLANLGTQSLGQVLFSSPLLVRKKIQIATFDSH